MNSNTSTKPAKKPFAERARDLWNYFSLYEKIWFFSILILASVCAVRSSRRRMSTASRAAS